MSRHKLTAYRASLLNVLKAQISSERLEPGLEGVMQLAESVALQVHLTMALYGVCCADMFAYGPCCVSPSSWTL